MSGTFTFTTDEKPRDLGDLARGIHWAQLIVDAALPLHGAPRGSTDESIARIVADRAALRATAFAGVQRAMTEHRYTARPSVLEALMDGRMPPLEDPS